MLNQLGIRMEKIKFDFLTAFAPKLFLFAVTKQSNHEEDAVELQVAMSEQCIANKACDHVTSINRIGPYWGDLPKSLPNQGLYYFSDGTTKLLDRTRNSVGRINTKDEPSTIYPHGGPESLSAIPSLIGSNGVTNESLVYLRDDLNNKTAGEYR